VTPAELRATDCIGLPRFTAQQAKAVIDLVRSTGKLNCDPPACEGRGIVIAGGGKYLSWTWVLLRHLRATLKTQLPIQVWHLGPNEVPGQSKRLFAQLDAETIDAHQVMMKHPVREMGGWPLKTYAVRHCPWEQVMFCDADSFARVLPEELFNDKDVKSFGSLFFEDIAKHHKCWGYVDCGLIPLKQEWETGQFIWDKTKAWMALRWALWMHEHTDVFYQNFHGDKGVIEAAMRMSNCPYIMGEKTEWEGSGVGQYFKGRRVFSHMMATKRHEFPMEPWMQAAFEEWKTIKL
jgi:Mannosyltransferase putative